MMNITKTQLITYSIVLLTGLILGWLIFGEPGQNGSHTSHEQLGDAEMEQHVQEEHTDEQGNTVWTCSMHPSVRENEPGNCPICGMELIPVSEMNGEAETDEYSMVMTGASMKLADIRTTPAIRDVPQKELRLPGRITVDERRLSYVTAHFEGRIRNVNIDFTGAPIREGEVMATVYSPELVSAQRELIEADRSKDRNPNLFESAMRKFRLWEFTDEQIQAIIDRGEVQTDMEILSPVDGYVMKRNVVDEQHVSEGTVIYEVAPLDQLWVVLEAYEEDFGWIRTGDDIEFSTRAQPGKTHRASVNFIDPMFNPNSRTIRVRADIENPGEQLRPDMLVNATLMASSPEESVLVPASSVLWTGPRSLVYVKDSSADNPRFEVREVELGHRFGDFYEIESGIEEGEEVVFNGSFRIDSEFQLADKFSMMNREPGSGSNRAGHDHGEMDMSLSADTTQHQHNGHTQQDGGQAGDHSHDEHLQLLVGHYLDIKNALASDDFETATGAFVKFAGEVRSSEEMNQHEEHAERHETHHNAMLEAIGLAAEAENIEAFRLAFREISAELLTAIENQGFDGVLYKQYCPMYEGGSNWISDSEEIENPFYGARMHNCGETVERIDM
jgi:membrane fusion protein, copper/silver efflux system